MPKMPTPPKLSGKPEPHPAIARNRGCQVRAIHRTADTDPGYIVEGLLLGDASDPGVVWVFDVDCRTWPVLPETIQRIQGTPGTPSETPPSAPASRPLRQWLDVPGSQSRQYALPDANDPKIVISVVSEPDHTNPCIVIEHGERCEAALLSLDDTANLAAALNQALVHATQRKAERAHGTGHGISTTTATAPQQGTSTPR